MWGIELNFFRSAGGRVAGSHPDGIIPEYYRRAAQYCANQALVILVYLAGGRPSLVYHSPTFVRAGSAKAGIHNLNKRDACLLPACAGMTWSDMA